MFAMHSNILQQIALHNRCERILTRAFSNLILVLLQCLLLIAVTKENILSTIAFLAGAMSKVKHMWQHL